MDKKSVTLTALRKININNVYNFIHKEIAVSKQLISKSLQMSMSAVNQNIKDLEDRELIVKDGCFDSTGGRKADMFRIVRTARLAIGVGILKKEVYMSVVDLYGKIIHSASFKREYEDTPAYYEQVCGQIDSFIKDNEVDSAKILGIAIATQGIISADGQSVSYGKIMGNHQMNLSDFTKYMPYPCILEHDSKAAATLEIWNNKSIVNAVLILLNPNMGGALIINREVVQGIHMHAGAIEHICISKDGPLCYCGNRGCLETYCSASVIEEISGSEIKLFFKRLRKGSVTCQRIWTDFLEKLAFVIRNISINIDGDIIISGYMAPYITEDDIRYLMKKIEGPPFAFEREQIIVGTHGQFTPAVGAALHYIDAFLKSV